MSEEQVREPRTDVVVIGGGLAGLTAAATAAKAGRSVILLDARPLGGRARVDRRGGYAFNQGPRALYLGGAGQQVLSELGVATDRGGPPVLKGALGLTGGRLGLLPQGPGSLLRTSLLTAGEKLEVAKLLASFPRLDLDRFAGLTVDDAVDSFGLGAMATGLVTALVRLATYTAATDVLDAPSGLAQLKMALDPGVIYLDGGWQSLVDGLERVARATGADIRTGEPVREVIEHDGDPVVVTRGGAEIAARTVVIAAGGPDAAASVLGDRPAGWERLGPPAAAACLELGLRRPPSTRLVVGIDEPVYLSTHCPPADLAPDGGAVVHVMRYLRHDESRSSQTTRSDLRNLARLVGVTDDDIVEERFLAAMVVTGAVPTASGGLAGRPPVEVEGRAGVLVAGDWVGAHGLLGDAALASGAEAGRLAVDRSATLEPA